MNLNNIKLNFIRDNNKEALQIINKIEDFSNLYNVSINKAITYFLANYTSQYQLRILKICRAIYPFDGQFDPNIFNGPFNKDEIIVNIHNFKKDKKRISHIQDALVFNKKIGIQDKKVLLDNINKTHNLQPQIIDPNKIITVKKNVKIKKRID